MSGRNSLQIKKQILEALKSNESLTYAQLEKKVNSNWQTIRSHCKELEIFGCININNKKSHDLNNKPYSEIQITTYGLEVLVKIN